MTDFLHESKNKSKLDSPKTSINLKEEEKDLNRREMVLPRK